jgi:hypothetical protein
MNNNVQVAHQEREQKTTLQEKLKNRKIRNFRQKNQ